ATYPPEPESHPVAGLWVELAVITGVEVHRAVVRQQENAPRLHIDMLERVVSFAGCRMGHPPELFHRAAELLLLAGHRMLHAEAVAAYRGRDRMVVVGEHPIVRLDRVVSVTDDACDDESSGSIRINATNERTDI